MQKFLTMFVSTFKSNALSFKLYSYEKVKINKNKNFLKEACGLSVGFFFLRLAYNVVAAIGSGVIYTKT